MVGSRTVTAIAGLVASLLASVALPWYFDSLVFFLFLPFVPFLFRRRRTGQGGTGRSGAEPDDAGPEPSVRECPACGFRTRRDDYEYCPRDGRRLG